MEILCIGHVNCRFVHCIWFMMVLLRVRPPVSQYPVVSAHFVLLIIAPTF